jgi:predicted NAD/FAD-binding protein
MRPRIAVIGGGIAGLSAAWLLSRRYDVHLFEKATRLGGHTHTHVVPDVDAPGGVVHLDTGFLVHNNRTYPHLLRLFDELGVERLDSDMSFAVSSRNPDFEYSSRDLNGLFAQRSNLVRPGHYRLLAEILRFNREAPRLLARPGADNITLGDFLDSHKFSGEFLERFLFPMASAVWSAALPTLRGFPATTLIRFFHNHGMLSATDNPVWRVVRGGSSAYIPRLVDVPHLTVHTDAAPAHVVRTATGVQISFPARPTVDVDEVVFACHGDEVLPMLRDASPLERDVLSSFTTSLNDTWLHTDPSFLPRRAAARASWNVLIGEREEACLTYDLNRLQRLSTPTQYAVTLNPPRPIPEDRVLARMSYTHPLFTQAAVRAQGRWAEISGRNRLHLCGAYWFYGFHEDGVRSGVRVAESLGVTW